MALDQRDDRRLGSFADGQAVDSAGEGPRGRFSTGQERADRARPVERGRARSAGSRNAGAGRRP
jgi:hypothetical protein